MEEDPKLFATVMKSAAQGQGGKLDTVSAGKYGDILVRKDGE